MLPMPNATHFRLWLPEQLCARGEDWSALVGWVNEGLKSVDIVVVGSCPIPPFPNDFAGLLKEVLDSTESQMPIGLRSERKLCVVGEHLPQGTHSTSSSAFMAHESKVWAVVSAHRSSEIRDQLEWIPYLHSLSFGGCQAVGREQLIVIYQQPLFGSHHFSRVSLPHKSGSHKSRTSSTSKETRWLTALNPQEAPDMDMVMTELNCSRYVHETVNNIFLPSAANSQKCSVLHSIFFKYLGSFTALFVAIWATVLYGLAVILTVWLPTFPYLLQKSVLCQAMHIRCQQFMAWPFILLWGGLGPEQPNVAIAHKMTIAKHSMWSVLLIDKVIGAISGFLLLKHQVSITELAVKTGKVFTNDVLRTSCVWFMGVPAGFKLNNELAAVFGTLSLHFIQSWSALFSALTPGIGVLLHVLGISSFFLGFTVLAAMVSDILFLSTFHVSCLHSMIAFLYTNQLRALAALWRLFRGRKRNSLRGRLDTFDCSVEQLVVGSLMFVPLLLLLPTTSVFYTFFSIIILILSSMRLILHYLISTLHCFPFSLVVTWIVRPKQFPSGLWFELPETTCCQNNQEGAILSMSGIQIASLAELLKPFARDLLATLEWSSASSFCYKVVSGESCSMNLKLRNIASFPHTPVSLDRFAWFCYEALLRIPGSISPK